MAVVLAKPPATQPGDLLVAIIAGSESSFISPPAGWTVRATYAPSPGNTANPSISICSKVATASDNAVTSYSFGAASVAVGILTVYDDPNSTTAPTLSNIAFLRESFDELNPYVAAPSVTPPTTDTTLVCAWATNRLSPPVPPAGMVERGSVAQEDDDLSPEDGISLTVADEPRGSNAPTGTRSATALGGSSGPGTSSFEEALGVSFVIDQGTSTTVTSGQVGPMQAGGSITASAQIVSQAPFFVAMSRTQTTFSAKTVAYPAAAAAGDVAILLMATTRPEDIGDDPEQVIPPRNLAGWTRAGTLAGATPKPEFEGQTSDATEEHFYRSTVYTRVISAGDLGTSVSYTESSTMADLSMYVYRGVDVIDPIGALAPQFESPFIPNYVEPETEGPAVYIEIAGSPSDAPNHMAIFAAHAFPADDHVQTDGGEVWLGAFIETDVPTNAAGRGTGTVRNSDDASSSPLTVVFDEWRPGIAPRGGLFTARSQTPAADPGVTPPIVQPGTELPVVKWGIALNSAYLSGLQVTGSVSLSGRGTIAANASSVVPAAASLSAVGSISTFGRVTVRSNPIDLSTTSYLEADGTPIYLVTGSILRLVGEASLTMHGTGGVTLAGASLSVAGSASAFTTPPSNDPYATPNDLLGETGTIAGTLENASRETGEPTITGSEPQSFPSVWFRWVAPKTATFVFDLKDTAPHTPAQTVAGVVVQPAQYPDLFLRVWKYRGQAVYELDRDLDLVTENDDYALGDQAKALLPRVQFDAVEGQEYRIQVLPFAYSATTAYNAADFAGSYREALTAYLEAKGFVSTIPASVHAAAASLTGRASLVATVPTTHFAEASLVATGFVEADPFVRGSASLSISGRFDPTGGNFVRVSAAVLRAQGGVVGRGSYTWAAKSLLSAGADTEALGGLIVGAAVDLLRGMTSASVSGQVATSGRGAIYPGYLIQHVVDTADGQDFPIVAEWEAFEEAPGGFVSASGRLPASVIQGAPHVYRFGARWRTFDLKTGDLIFVGRLLDPEPSRGSYQIAARGPSTILERNVQRLLYQTYDLSEWATGDSDPFDYEGSEKFDVRIGGRRITIRDSKDEKYKTAPTKSTPAVFWNREGDLRYIAFDVVGDYTTNDYELEVVSAKGPKGALSVRGTIGFSGDRTKNDQKVTIPGDDDLVGLRLVRTTNTATKTAKKFAVKIDNLRVNGIARSDDWSTTDVVRDIASRAGLNDNDIQDFSTPALPADFTDGSLADALNEIALLDDARWLVRDFGRGPFLDYGSWNKRVWHVEEVHAEVDLIPIERYNGVRVPYRARGGVSDYVTVKVDPNPFAGGADNIYDLALDDPLPPYEVSKIFGDRVAGYLSQRRSGGSARIQNVKDENGVEYPAHVVHAGDVVVLSNYGDQRLRVKALRRTNEECRVDFDEDMATLEKWLARRRRRLALGVPPSKATLAGDVVGNDDPKVPTGVDMNFSIRETKQSHEYRGIVTWNEVTEDVLNEATGIDRYEVQIEPTDAAGNPQAEGDRYRKTVGGRGKNDTDAPTRAVFDTIERPKKWYWRARVRAVDVANNRSDWSGWTTPKKPTESLVGGPPIPTNFRVVRIDAKEKDGRSAGNRAKLKWDEVTNFDVPGGDTQSDLARYVVELRVCSSTGVDELDDDGDPIGRKKNVSAKKDSDSGTEAQVEFFRIRKDKWYRFRIRSVDRFGRKSAWSDFTTPASASDSLAPPAPHSLVIDVDAHKIRGGWKANLDGSNERVVDDIDYFQYRLEEDGVVIREDLLFRGTEKTWKIKKPGTKTYRLRVRSVDGSGNVSSTWAAAPSVTGNKQDPPTPTSAPTIVFDDKDGTRNSTVRAKVSVTYSGVYTDDDIERYVVELETSNDTNFADKDDRVRRQSIDADSNRPAIFTKLKKKTWVRARFRVVDGKGHKSGWSNYSSAQRVTIARTLNGPSVTDIDKGKGRVGMKWNRATDSDGDHDQNVTHYQAELWRGTPEGPTSTKVEDDLVYGTRIRWVKGAGTGPYFPRVRAVDEFGNVSAWSGASSHEADAETGVEPGSLNDTHFQSGFQPVERVNSLPGLPHSRYPEGKVVYLTSDQRLYRSLGSSWTAHIDTSQLSGTITETQIGANSISTGKIQTNAINANHILAGQVQTDELASNSILAGHIQASQIDTDRLAANAITSKHSIIGATIATSSSGARVSMNAIAGENDRIRLYGIDGLRGVLRAEAGDAVFEAPGFGRAYIRLDNGVNKVKAGWLKTIDAFEPPEGAPGTTGDITSAAIYKGTSANRIYARFAGGTTKQFRFWEDSSA